MVSLLDSLKQSLVGTLTAVDLCVSVAVVKLLQLDSEPKAMQSHYGPVRRASSHGTEVYLSRQKHLYTKKIKKWLILRVLNRCATLRFLIKKTAASVHSSVLSI